MQADQQVSLALVLWSLEFSSTLLQLLWIGSITSQKQQILKRSPSLIPYPIWGCACLMTPLFLRVTKPILPVYLHLISERIAFYHRCVLPVPKSVLSRVPMHLPESSSSLQLADPSGYKALHLKSAGFESKMRATLRARARLHHKKYFGDMGCLVHATRLLQTQSTPMCCTGSCEKGFGYGTTRPRQEKIKMPLKCTSATNSQRGGTHCCPTLPLCRKNKSKTVKNNLPVFPS